MLARSLAVCAEAVASCRGALRALGELEMIALSSNTYPLHQPTGGGLHDDVSLAALRPCLRENSTTSQHNHAGFESLMAEPMDW